MPGRFFILEYFERKKLPGSRHRHDIHEYQQCGTPEKDPYISCPAPIQADDTETDVDQNRGQLGCQPFVGNGILFNPDHHRKACDEQNRIDNRWQDSGPSLAKYRGFPDHPYSPDKKQGDGKTRAKNMDMLDHQL